MRPKIICHMISSIDGRLLPDRWTPPAEGVATDIVGLTYEAIGSRFDAQGFIVGRSTMEELTGATSTLSVQIESRQGETHLGNRNGRDIAVVIDPKGKLRFEADNADGDHIVTVLGETVPDEYLAELRRIGVSYIFAGIDGADLSAAMETLSDVFGASVLLLEGGGRINGAFLNAGLIDEFSVLIYPGVDGLAGVPAIVDFDGERHARPASGRCLRHLSSETLEGGVVWLHYGVEDNPTPGR